MSSLPPVATGGFLLVIAATICVILANPYYLDAAYQYRE